MKFNGLERASDFEVQKWLIEELQLTPYQKSRLTQYELLRASNFYFYKRGKKPAVKFPLLWRLTGILFLVYAILSILIILPLKWAFTGSWGYSTKFYDKFHRPWAGKIGH